MNNITTISHGQRRTVTRRRSHSAPGGPPVPGVVFYGDRQSGAPVTEAFGRLTWAYTAVSAPSGTRTPNPLIKSQLLCQLS